MSAFDASIVSLDVDKTNRSPPSQLPDASLFLTFPPEDQIGFTLPPFRRLVSREKNMRNWAICVLSCLILWRFWNLQLIFERKGRRFYLTCLYWSFDTVEWVEAPTNFGISICWRDTLSFSEIIYFPLRSREMYLLTLLCCSNKCTDVRHWEVGPLVVRLHWLWKSPWRVPLLRLDSGKFDCVWFTGAVDIAFYVSRSRSCILK